MLHSSISICTYESDPYMNRTCVNNYIYILRFYIGLTALRERIKSRVWAHSDEREADAGLLSVD